MPVLYDAECDPRLVIGHPSMIDQIRARMDSKQPHSVAEGVLEEDELWRSAFVWVSRIGYGTTRVCYWTNTVSSYSAIYMTVRQFNWLNWHFQFIDTVHCSNHSTSTHTYYTYDISSIKNDFFRGEKKTHTVASTTFVLIEPPKIRLKEQANLFKLTSKHHVLLLGPLFVAFCYLQYHLLFFGLGSDPSPKNRYHKCQWRWNLGKIRFNKIM